MSKTASAGLALVLLMPALAGACGKDPMQQVVQSPASDDDGSPSDAPASGGAGAGAGGSGANRTPGGGGDVAGPAIANPPESDCDPGFAGCECSAGNFCFAGLECAGGLCALGQELPSVADCSLAQTVTGSLVTNVASVEFETVSATVRHKRDVDEFEDGCLLLVELRFRYGSGCELVVVAANNLRPSEGLRVVAVDFSADSQCPMFADENEGHYAASDSHYGSWLELSSTSIPDYNVESSCFVASFSAELTGEITADDGRTLSVDGTRLEVSGSFLSQAEEGACPVDCRGDAECGPGEFCDAERCTLGCRDDAQCPAGSICQGDVCQVGCRDDAACASGQICRDGECRVGCNDDEACGDYRICIDGVCQPGCRADEDCGAGSRCESNSCRAVDEACDCSLEPAARATQCAETCPDDCAPNCGVEAMCGDGVVDTGEACDDGNTAAGDGCEPDCTETPDGPVTTGISIEELVPDLDGWLFTIPCGDMPSADDCNSAGYRLGGGALNACVGGMLSAQSEHAVVGTPGASYDVTLHLYGVLEAKNYGSAVVRDAAPNRPSHETGGTPTPWARSGPNPDIPASAAAQYEIHVDDENGNEVAVYYPNAETSEGHYTMGIDYEQTIPVVGGGRIRIVVLDSNCRHIKNCSEGTFPCANKARTIDISAADPQPASLDQPGLGQTADHAGQWWLIDVVAVSEAAP